MEVVRRKTALVVGALVFLLGNSSVLAATNIAGLYATGAGGTNGHPDLHYKLISAPTGVPTNALIASTLPSSWIAAPADSRWLSPYDNANQSAPVGAYIYELTFTLTDSGGNSLDPTTASISGQFATDDWIEIVLNGNVIDTAPNTPGQLGFVQLFSFTANSGFVSGVNTLDFDVRNLGTGPSPTGLLVSDFCTSGTPLPVPEPGTWSLLALGVSTLLLRRFRS